MSSQNLNRHTQFNLQGLTGAELSTSTIEPDHHVTEKPPPRQERSVPEKNVLKRKKSLSPPRKVSDRRRIGVQYQGMIDGSPWDAYCKKFQLQLDDEVTVAVWKGIPRRRVIIKRFSMSDSQQELQMIHNVRNDNIVTALQTFRFEGSFYVVLERMAISLLEIVASPPYPGEQELAAIVGQVSQADVKPRVMR